MLTRLADKGWLHVRAEGNTFYYRAARARKSAVHGLLTGLLDTAFSGSASGLIMALLESRRLSSEDARRIRELIDRAAEDEA